MGQLHGNCRQTKREAQDLYQPLRPQQDYKEETLSIEEIASNATTFSVLDTSSGFWQVKLDDPSSKLCTFNTPFRHYKFNQLPFGISSAQDVFQAVTSEMFKDIEGVEVIIDDILVWGSTVEEHDARLE